jgi:hypothetical protein
MNVKIDSPFRYSYYRPPPNRLASCLETEKAEANGARLPTRLVSTLVRLEDPITILVGNSVSVVRYLDPGHTVRSTAIDPDVGTAVPGQAT